MAWQMRGMLSKIIPHIILRLDASQQPPSSHLGMLVLGVFFTVYPWPSQKTGRVKGLATTAM